MRGESGGGDGIGESRLRRKQKEVIWLVRGGRGRTRSIRERIGRGKNREREMRTVGVERGLEIAVMAVMQ